MPYQMAVSYFEPECIAMLKGEYFMKAMRFLKSTIIYNYILDCFTSDYIQSLSDISNCSL